VSAPNREVQPKGDLVAGYERDGAKSQVRDELEVKDTVSDQASRQEYEDGLRHCRKETKSKCHGNEAQY
jgi:hypothetical protein